MISWVALERIYEREILKDPKLRKQAGERPVRAFAQRLTDAELLAKLRFFGIEIDRAWLERKCERALSAQEIASPLMDQSGSRGLSSDWIWICVADLWRRWLPDQPSFEQLDDRMQAGYELLKTSGAVAACPIWLEAWHEVRRLLDKSGIGSIKQFDERFQGTQSLFNWIQDLEQELWNAGLKDREYLRARIEFCEEAQQRFPSDDDLMTTNRRRALAESYFELRETEKAEALYREWLGADPCWGWGWIGRADLYRYRGEHGDLNRSEQILREGLAVAGVRDRVDIAARLADVCEELGRDEEANEFRRQAERQAATEFSEDESPPAPEMVPETPTPRVTGRKVGRNEPCPCGSGKKFKKCCGA